MSKHTPGPWRVEYMDGPEEHGWHPRASAYVLTSKGTPPIRQNVEHPGQEDAEREANARMIAAAPELAVALRNLRDKAKAINAAQHSGRAITPDEWNELYECEIAASATLARAGL